MKRRKIASVSVDLTQPDRRRWDLAPGATESDLARMLGRAADEARRIQADDAREREAAAVEATRRAAAEGEAMRRKAEREAAKRKRRDGQLRTKRSTTAKRREVEARRIASEEPDLTDVEILDRLAGLGFPRGKGGWLGKLRNREGLRRK